MRRREITQLVGDGGTTVAVRINGRAYWNPTLDSLARLTRLPIRYDRYNWQARTITWVYPKEDAS